MEDKVILEDGACAFVSILLGRNRIHIGIYTVGNVINLCIVSHFCI